MSGDFRSSFEKIDFSDTRFMLAGIFLLLIPIIYLFFFMKVTEKQSVTTRISLADPGKQSAFSLTTTSKAVAAQRAKSVAPAVNPAETTIEAELERAWSRVQATPRRISLPPDLPKETRQMLEVEDDPMLAEANALFDEGDMAAAEKAYKSALSSSANNDFKNLHAWGGLMEVYLLTGNKDKFREAFKNYALTAQKLNKVYGPLADDVSRAYEMFEQISRIDPGKLREQLTRANLTLGTKVSFEEFMTGFKSTQDWYPKDMPTAEPVSPYSVQRDGGS
ncbi:MAG: hypothetical protein CVV41_20350 [Candidatus Riflebacteria bacterium HGW-Riflebacteria-1]|jgi:tetratricopeptide (TPR) repeat protein|nr:MAG: hypothetical protein CVV41_20350 [Candidatus Riflebacteria bacterium HGW-Riflebacteria-1]